MLQDNSKQVKEYQATSLSSTLLVNDGKGAFMESRLPYQAQWSSIAAFGTADFNGDGKMDILSGGNFYGAIPYEGKYDAGSLNVLLQEPGNRWSWLPRPQLGLDIKGEIRDIKTIRLAGKQTAFLFAINNDKIIVINKK